MLSACTGGLGAILNRSSLGYLMAMASMGQAVLNLQRTRYANVVYPVALAVHPLLDVFFLYCTRL